MNNFVLKAAGSKTTIGGSTSANVTADSVDRQFVLAGPGSKGILYEGSSVSPNIQFGTGPTDAVANTSVTCLYNELEGTGTVAEVVTTDSEGNQSVGFGRVTWNAVTKQLKLKQYKDDALVSSSPRTQLYTYRLPHRLNWYRFVFEFSCGADELVWPTYRDAAGFNEILVWQMKNDADPPSFELSFVSPSGVDKGKRNLALSYRETEIATKQDLIVIEDVETLPNIRHSVIIDFCLDFVDASGGGHPYLAFWYNGTQREFSPGVYTFTQNNVYSASATVARPMIGMYRYGYSAKALDGCGLTVHCARLESTSDGPPPFWPQNDYSIFSELGKNKSASARISRT